MFEKTNPSHPDKVADRIAGAIVDASYRRQADPKVACEVLIGHGNCHIINETSAPLSEGEVRAIVSRIAGPGYEVDYLEVPQDPRLAENQKDGMRCGDNGIFRGCPTQPEQADLARECLRWWESGGRTDGKLVLHANGGVTVCQSNVGISHPKDDLGLSVNPLGPWTGGPGVDAGATNRKLGSDMGDAATGGGLHGKDLSKADVSANIFLHLLACALGRPVEATCSIGDKTLLGVPYPAVVACARAYIDALGGFEAFAEWGLIRP